MDRSAASDVRLDMPLRLLPNRVWRMYRGGKLLDELRGRQDAADTDRPEDWVGSDTRARNPGGPPDEGLAAVDLPNGPITVAELISREPEIILGWDHTQHFGPRTALLVKLLDAAIRLPIHAHPDRYFASAHLNSPFGKTEAWLIISTRPDTEETPHILLGMKDAVTPEQFARWIAEQNSTAMMAAMHRLNVRPGDVYYVRAGLPHALGPGIFMVEVQEPTDFSILAEYRAFGVAEEDAHLGLGWSLALQAFDLHPYTSADIERDFKIEPVMVRQQGNSTRWRLLDVSFFGAERLEVRDLLTVIFESFAIAIVTNGKGTIVSDHGTTEIARGDTLLLPAALGAHTYRTTTSLDVLVCLPPKRL
jgi:mannose-6-phosphate isomerase